MSEDALTRGARYTRGMAKQNTSVYFGPPRDDAESEAFARVLSHSFGRSEQETALWVATHERANLRVLAEHGSVIAGMCLVRMGQHFNGLRVGMVGIQGVGVAPNARGRGAASDLMDRTLRELQTEGVPLSTLYPANQTLYRRSGYEQAGHRFEVRVPLHRIAQRGVMKGGDGLSVREGRVQGADAAKVRSVYAAFAAACQGSLDRNALIWKRIEFPPPIRTEPARLFLIERGRVTEGYVYLTQTASPNAAGAGRYDVVVHDMAAITTSAARRLWAFLAGYSTIGIDLVWMTGPTNPLLLALPEQTYKPMTLKDHWMLRIVDLKGAMHERGWPAGMDATLTMNVKDVLLRENNGRWALRVRDGEASTRRLPGRSSTGRSGGLGISCDIGALATLYAGFQAAPQLAMDGRVQGSPESLELAAAVFASTRGVPMLTDMF